jgi:transcriptional regulator with XRE-family HTH domain
MTQKHEQEFKKIGLNIAYFRKLKGFSQLQLAETVGISRTHMSNIEAPNMPTSISLETLMDIADALEIPVQSLFSFHWNVEDTSVN